MTQDPFNPYQPPESAQLEAPGDPHLGDGQLPPLPWEDKERHPEFWKRVGGMFNLVFSDPLGYFARVPRGQGLMQPWLFQMLLMAPIFLIVGLIFGIAGVAGSMAAMGGGRGVDALPGWLFALLLPVFAILMPLFIFLGMVIGGALNHFFLWIWGGLKQGQPIDQTIRAQAYAQAFIALGGMIPYLGILVQLAGMVWLGMGLARMHRTDTWRGVCAALTPIFLLCCCGIIAAITIPALIAGWRH